jgi:hypothetical protein
MSDAGGCGFDFPRGPVPVTEPYVMNAVEVQMSIVRGMDPTISPLARTRGSTASAVRTALERAVLPALENGPCLVAFSGGLDSSTVLAAAAAAARAHGLPLPIPATNRFPEDPTADESRWQDMVVCQLGLDDWVKLDLADELDLVGPYASSGLLRHGVVWPPNAHFLAPLAAQAAGGTLLTGIGGDELFTPSATRGAWVLARQISPRRTDVLEVARVLAPARVKRRWIRARFDAPEWLTPRGRRMWTEALSIDISKEPLWWGRSVVDDWWRSRSRLGVVASVAAIAGSDARVMHPFMDPEFAAGLADAKWKTGFRRRSDAIEFVCGDALPRKLRERPDKTAFFTQFVNRHSRSFIDTWDGAGVDPELVDSDALRRVWHQPEVDARSYATLQAAWLATQSTRG